MTGVTRGVRLEGREQSLTETFVTLADTLVGDFDVADFLYHLVERCVDLFDVAEAGLMLAEPGGGLLVMASTSDKVHLIELLQIQNQQGPCFDCFRSGKPVLVAALDADEAARWPVFVETARGAGFASVAALPMRLRNQVIGALNLFRSEPGILAPTDVMAAQALADVATISLLQDRAARDSRLVMDQLQGALNSRVIIEQAKGIIAQRLGVDMAEAFSLVRMYSRNRNERLTAVAQQLVEGKFDANQLSRV